MRSCWFSRSGRISGPSGRWRSDPIAAYLSARYGLARSRLIYRGVPLRGRRLRAFYASRLRRGDLAFDVGAHVGNHLDAMLRLGVRVVALEPHPEFARYLRRRFAARRGLAILQVAVGDRRGSAELRSSSRAPTVSSISTAWIERVSRAPGFARIAYDRVHEVPLTTLDRLIQSYGTPAFIKLDVEGSEPDALRGLSSPVRALSFEYIPAAAEFAIECIELLGALGRYEFNWAIGESTRLEEPLWLGPDEMTERIGALDVGHRSGDVHARIGQRR